MVNDSLKTLNFGSEVVWSLRKVPLEINEIILLHVQPICCHVKKTCVHLADSVFRVRGRTERIQATRGAYLCVRPDLVNVHAS